MFDGFDFDVIQRSAGYLFREGMTFTLTLTAMAMSGGIVFGTLLAMMRLSGRRALVLPAAAYVNLDLVDPAMLESMDRVDLVRAYDRCEAALAAGKTRAIAAVADAYQDLGMPASEARHEIGAALRLSPVTAADRTAVAVDLRDRFPRTLALLDEGRICWLHAANLSRGTIAARSDDN